MKQIDALKLLLTHVVADNPVRHTHFPAAFPSETSHGREKWMDAIGAFDGSFDCAYRFCTDLFPGCPVEIADYSQEYLGAHGWRAAINWPHMVHRETFTAAGPFCHEAWSETPARALLIVVIKAKIAELKSTNNP